MKLFSRAKNKATLIHYKLQGKQFIHFLHIGKTGGSAVKYAIRSNLQIANPIKDAFKTNEYLIILHGHSFKLRYVPRGEKTFFFLRDPIDRFVSAFYARKRQDRPLYNAPWNPGEKMAYCHFDTPNQLAIALSSDDESEIGMARDAMKNIKHIKHHYSRWFDSENYLLSRKSDILFIGFQKNLEQDFEIFKSKLNLSDNVKLPEDDFYSHKSLKGEDKTLEDKAIENLRDWYCDDYKFLNLCREIRKDHTL